MACVLVGVLVCCFVWAGVCVRSLDWSVVDAVVDVVVCVVFGLFACGCGCVRMSTLGGVVACLLVFVCACICVHVGLCVRSCVRASGYLVVWLIVGSCLLI